jgi:hypothetical protein
MRRTLQILAAAGLLSVVPGALHAQAPTTTALTYQGRLMVSGLPATGTYDFEFRVFTADLAGSQLGSTVSIPALPVNDGLFSAKLDFGQPQFNSAKRWLQIAVRPAGNGTLTILSPRQELTAAPYAAGLIAPITVHSGQATESLNITNTGGTAVYGKSTFGVGTAGVQGVSTANHGNGVRGTANTGASAYGVWGEATSGIGVRGHGGTYGVFGSGPSGVYGQGGNTGIGVRGDGNFGAHLGSTLPGGTGVYCYAGADSLSYAVWAQSSLGKAGYFSGNVSVVGSLSKSGGSFKIDHPLDPANKYLYHSFVESPDMMNIYNGNAQLDASGSAIVTLPDWFESLNADFRYQLTAIGAPAPNLHISRGIENRQFAIAGGPPFGEVSWMVTGIRIDPWANANRIPVEELKEPHHRGLYIHPEVYGLPASDSVDSIKLRKMNHAVPFDPAAEKAASHNQQEN